MSGTTISTSISANPTVSNEPGGITLGSAAYPGNMLTITQTGTVTESGGHFAGAIFVPGTLGGPAGFLTPPATITNFGDVVGASYGIELQAGGTLTVINEAGATISGATAGITDSSQPSRTRMA